MELDIRYYLRKATEQQDCAALQSAYSIMKTVTAAGASGRIAPQLYVVCAETALQLGCLEISTVCLKMFFEGNPPADQFLCRAYLCLGQLKCPPATANVESFEEAVLYFLKAIEISKHEPRYHFIVFNASVLYFQTVRPLLQPGRCLHLVPSLRQVVQSLEEVADQDHSWRAELMMHLIKCLVDSGKAEDAADLAKVTEELVKSHTPHLYPRLFTLLVQHNLTNGDVILDMSRQDATLAVIYKIQDFKRLQEIKKAELTKEDSAKLEEIFHILDCTKASAVPTNHSPVQSPVQMQPADRVAFLLELALLALQVKHQKVAADCLKELKSSREASTGQCMVIECVNSEINLLKKEAKMNEYSKASVEARLKEIGKLDQWLQSAATECDPQAVQAVCATQWRFCLPLLQHNLRKHIKMPLLKVVQVLEDIQSLLLDMRCQIHSELAAIEEEEGRLEAALTHLQKAALLDNGTQRERLTSALHLLQLRGSLYQKPSRTEDKAAMLMQQVRDVQPQDKTDICPSLVAVGLLLGADDFQMVLDGDNTSKSCQGSGPVAQLSAKAQHHSASLQKVGGHLHRQDCDTDSTERMKLWATLVKTARKQEVWDVCRAACRFCLLYDDGRWNLSKTKRCRCSVEESCAECLHGCSESETCARDHLRLLAEIHFISAEATVQKLLTEGVQLNSPAAPPQEERVNVPEEDAHWVIYRDWIQGLSSYATSSFLRAAEIGLEIKEPWLVANAATYLWNYSSHLLLAGEYQRLLPSFQSLVEMLRKAECPGTRALLVLLCNAVAQGLIQPLCGPDIAESTLPGDRAKSRGEKGTEKDSAVLGGSLDPAALQDVRTALELCDYALHLSNMSTPGEMVPIAAKKQVVGTWVQVKRLLQHQIGTNIKDECGNEEVSAMTRVLVGVEMLQCNRNPRHMEFSVSSLSTLVGMTSECSWTDALVEMQVWCQLAAFCHYANDHDLVLCCTKSALQLEAAAARSIMNVPCALYDLTTVNEMLSTAACLRGLSLVHVSNGDLHTYREAMDVLLSSVSYAVKAKNQALCITASRHYWNTCLPLTQTPEERWQLQDPLKKILNSLIHTTPQQVKVKGLLTLTTLPRGSSEHEALDEEDRTLKAAIYSFLFHIYTDKNDWKSALKLLDNANRDMHHTKYSLPFLKHSILLKARLGKSVLMDMKKLQNEGEQCCSHMWRQVASMSTVCDISQQLTCYQKSITSFMSSESLGQKVNLLLEFGEWLYCHNFPKSSALHQVQWAIDILLQLEPEEAADDQSRKKTLSGVGNESSVGVQGLLFRQNLSNLKDVRCLDSLVRAHTLLAIMADRNSPEHEHNLLRACSFVIQIWQVSMAVAYEIEMTNKELPQHPLSAGSKKGKDKSKGKKDVKMKDAKETTPVEERPKPVILDQVLPSSLKDWARYICPDQVRQTFRTTSNPQCINAYSIAKQTQSLFYLNLLEKELRSLSLDHLILPILHLSETIAHDLLDMRSLSDLYRLRILRTCCQLGLETLSPYREKLQSLCGIQEQEQMECRKLIACLKEGRAYNQEAEVDKNVWSGRSGVNVCVQDIWLDKAEVCRSMGLYQPARQLLAEAHLVASELGDQKAVARSLLGLAILACEEQNYAQALILVDKAGALSGDEEFWYLLTLTKVRAVVGQRNQDVPTMVDQIIKHGCGVLQLVLDQQLNRVPELTFLITSLEMKGAMECTCALAGGEPGETFCTEATQRLMAACNTLKECASSFTKLGYRREAAEAHAEYTHGIRILVQHTSDKEEKQWFLLDGLSHMQLAVSMQEHVVLNAQSSLPPHEEIGGISLAGMRRLLRLRLTLAELCLAVLEVHCEEEKCQALAREKKTSAEIALEEFTRCTPEPHSIEQEWLNAVSAVGQVALGQLSAVSSRSVDDLETRAHYLSLMGKYLRLQAVLEDPVYMCALWDKHQHGEESAKVKERESSREELRMISAKSLKLQVQGRSHKAQQLLAQATKALAEAISLCLQHNLPSCILTDASVNMLECHGQSDTAAAGQYVALFQSCCTVATIAEVLNCACADTSVSQLSALLSLHKKLLVSQEESPSSMLRGAEQSLNSLSKAFRHLTINPNHLNILAELPPNLKILLLQHSENGSELYGAFYELTKPPANQKGKTTHVTGTLTCSKVAKVSVCPQALHALREQVWAFGQETRHAFLTEACWRGADGGLEASENQTTAAEEKLVSLFCKIVQDMEDYLHSLLTQFDFSCLRLQAASGPGLEMTKFKDKEESAKLPGETGEYVVLLTDRKLLDLPLESLSVLREENLSSVSRDFSLQLLHSRLNREEPEKVESDNKKETKGGKGTKGKGDQSQSIKVISATPSNTYPVETKNFKYIVDPWSEGNFDGTGLSRRMTEILETHSKHLTHLWEGFMGSKQIPSLSEMEQLLCKCSAFMYVGMERFMANVPPAKVAALSLSDCRMALLFEHVYNNATNLRRSYRAGQFNLERHVDTALLLTLAGVSCVVLNQWSSSVHQNTLNMASALDNLLRLRQTSGQTIHTLRKANASEKFTDPRLPGDSEPEDVPHIMSHAPSAFNCILYGLPNLIFM